MTCCTNVQTLPPFSSQVTAQDPPTANSIELLKQEIQSYLRRLRTALLADVECLCDRIEAIETRLTALENP